MGSIMKRVSIKPFLAEVLSIALLSFTNTNSWSLSLEEREKIKLGMSIAEVEAVLGAPNREPKVPNLPSNQKVSEWKENKSWILVWYADGKAATIQQSEDLMPEKLREIMQKYSK